MTDEVSADTIQTLQSQLMTLGLGKIRKCDGKPVYEVFLVCGDSRKGHQDNFKVLSVFYHVYSTKDFQRRLKCLANLHVLL